MRIGYDLCNHSHHPAHNVKNEITPRPHRVFDFWTKGPQEDHVADDVRPTAVQKHRRYDRDPVMAGNNLGGYRRPVGDKRIPTDKLQRKYAGVRKDNDNCYDGDVHGASRGISKGDHRSHSVFLPPSIRARSATRPIASSLETAWFSFHRTLCQRFAVNIATFRISRRASLPFTKSVGSSRALAHLGLIRATAHRFQGLKNQPRAIARTQYHCVPWALL